MKRPSPGLLYALLFVVALGACSDPTGSPVAGDEEASGPQVEPGDQSTTDVTQASAETEASAETDGSAETGAAETDPADLGSVTLAVPVPTAYYMIPSLGRELQLFEEQGLDVDVQYVQPGAMSPALASGEIEFGVLPGPAVHDLVLAGADLRFVASYIHQPALSLVTRGDVEDVEGLRGQAVVVGVPTSLSTIFMRQVLRDAGLDPDGDVQARTIPGQPETLNALLSGQVAGIMTSVPQTLVAEREGNRVLLDLTESDYTWPFAGIVTRDSYAQENPEVVEAVLAATVGALEAWEENPDVAKEVIRTEAQLDDPELVDAAYEAVAAVIDTEPIPTVEENEAVLDALEESGEQPAAAEARPEDFFDTTYIERVLEG